MVGGGELSFNAKTFVKGSHILSSKLWSTIEEDLLWKTVEIEDVSVVYPSYTFGSDSEVDQYEVALVRVVVDVNSNWVHLWFSVAEELSD